MRWLEHRGALAKIGRGGHSHASDQTSGQITEDVAKHVFRNQHIESRCPGASRADTICYATKENQDAAHQLGRDPAIEAIVVIGGTRSANTRHLWEICQRYKPSHLIQGAADLDPAWLAGVDSVGLTAGASTPDYVVDEVEAALDRIARATEPARTNTEGGWLAWRTAARA